MEVRWSTLAAEDLERIFRRIAKDNPTAARETVKTICDGCRELSRFPNLGRPGRMSGRRELIFPPYIAVYQSRSTQSKFLAYITARRTGLRTLLSFLPGKAESSRRTPNLIISAP
jgi:toxin ParE1/3/4